MEGGWKRNFTLMLLNDASKVSVLCVRLYSWKDVLTINSSMNQRQAKPKTVGVIPARFASTRLPGKPLTKILGKPLLQWVIEGVKTAKLIDEIIVATDHPEIQKLAQSLDVTVAMTSPDCPTGSDRCFAATKDRDFDFLVNIQGDEPLISGVVLDQLIKGLSISGDMATLVTTLKEADLQNPNTAKVVADKNNNALYFSRLAIPFTRSDMKSLPDLALKHIGVYAYTRDAFFKFCKQAPTTLEQAESLEQLRALWMGLKIKLVKVEHESVGVDTPEDVQKVEKILKAKG
jgi:3-deoxy-manno-octulosonate cytidylyltransferase (CMP-KDO synthetase)